MTKQFDDLVTGVAKKLADDGKLIEAGWVGLKMAAVAPDAPELQLREMRMSFFAGAAHLFQSIMSVLDDGDDATAGDMRKMTLIQQELDAFLADFTAKHMPTKGNG